jgi:hypothetical protein
MQSILLALRELGEAAEMQLRKAWGSQPSPEDCLRIDLLIGKLKPAAAAAEGLRTSRVLQVLELSAEPEARKVLRMLAQGDAEAPLTREAKAALERLQQR